ncbi:MAG: ribonuclease H family protein [Muribaculaceae bacterium]|nr:ribonuclease H family protein [Muribaculaceae bacterium]
MGKKFYVVWEGRATGVFDSWEECKEYTENYPGAKFKAYPSQEAAVAAFRGDPAEQMGLLKSIASYTPPVESYDAFPEILQDSLAVDAACSHNPGPVEYRGVWVRTGQTIFHAGPFENGTNNIGEFLALVHGLALLKAQGLHNTPIYTDSRTARSWVRNRQVKTTLERTPQNEPLFDMMERALAWLDRNTYANPILVWNTPAWGEIPADFGRK